MMLLIQYKKGEEEEENVTGVIVVQKVDCRACVAFVLDREGEKLSPQLLMADGCSR